MGTGVFEGENSPRREYCCGITWGSCSSGTWGQWNGQSWSSMDFIVGLLECWNVWWGVLYITFTVHWFSGVLATQCRVSQVCAAVLSPSRWGSSL